MARDRLDRNKNNLNKREEFLETYIQNTLNDANKIEILHNLIKNR